MDIADQVFGERTAVGLDIDQQVARAVLREDRVTRCTLPELATTPQEAYTAFERLHAQHGDRVQLRVTYPISGTGLGHMRFDNPEQLRNRLADESKRPLVEAIWTIEVVTA